uniref:Cell division cycle 40 n=1 Tax=Molossus molossus TaxID=27622 RepID=A0A7J8GP54_MOLMO|nr:cell division cycle 40 [Molossus molossus]
MSAAIAALAASYGSGSGSESDSDSEGGRCPLPAADSLMHLTKSPSDKPSLAVAVDSAPEVAVKEDLETGVHLDPAVKEVQYNPTYETMFAPEFGPENPFRTQQMAAPRNMLSGYAEPAHINDFMFEQQRRTFATYGYALDPSLDNQVTTKYIGSVEEAEKNQGLTVFETGQKKIEKRKKFKENDASNIDGFLGPWAKYVDEKDVAKPSEEEQKELDEITAKRQKKGKLEEEKPGEEKTILHVKEMYDYQGRSYLHIPQDVGVNLRSSVPPEKCYLPKKQIHVWSGHTKGVSAVRLFPLSGHLLLSCSMDCKIKVTVKLLGTSVLILQEHSSSVQLMTGILSSGTLRQDSVYQDLQTEKYPIVSNLILTKISKISLWLGCLTKRLCNGTFEVEKLCRNMIGIWELSTPLFLLMRTGDL